MANAQVFRAWRLADLSRKSGGLRKLGIQQKVTSIVAKMRPHTPFLLRSGRPTGKPPRQRKSVRGEVDRLFHPWTSKGVIQTPRVFRKTKWKKGILKTLSVEDATGPRAPARFPLAAPRTNGKRQ